CEELFFRGALYGWMRGRFPALVAIPVSAMIFAGAHVIIPLMPTLFVFGLGAAWIRERTGSTLNSFAMHATQNTFAVAATYLLVSLFRALVRALNIPNRLSQHAHLPTTGQAIRGLDGFL